MFFSLRNKIVGAHFLMKWIFGNFNLKTTSILKAGLIFYQAAKLGKSSRNAYNSGLLLILQDLLKNWVAEGVASDINDFNYEAF